MNKRGRKTSAVEYIRVSGLGQVEGDGETRQKETNTTFAKREGYSIDASYFDAGVSGCNDIEGREALQALFEYIEEKDIRICIVEGADRVARDLMVSECILDRFRKLGCKVVESRSGQDLTNAEDNPTQELVQKILAVVAMFDKKTTVKKLKAARDRKRKSGKKVEGRKAYGEVDATEKEIIALARKLRRKPRAYGKQRSFEAVATELNALGHRNRSGGKWSGQMVRRILR
jgi:DNA invertase Pin-like site-specific DNA recombinase